MKESPIKGKVKTPKYPVPTDKNPRSTRVVNAETGVGKIPIPIPKRKK